MKILQTLAVVVFATALAVAQQSTPATQPSAAAPTVSGVLDRQLSGVEKEIVPLAEAMPEAKYNYAPTQGEFKGVRNFLQQISHVAAVNYLVGAAMLQEKPPVAAGDGENGTAKNKAEAVQQLKDSFTYLHKAFASVNEQNLVTPIKSPFGNGQMTRLGGATLLIGHNFNHYGQCVEYLRANGIIPPASRK